MPARQPTSRDVAALAQVSVATVSYVMNDRTDRRISAATRDRVRAAARELAYAPSRSARSLRQRRTEQVCLVVGAIGVPACDDIAGVLHAAADAAGYGVFTILANSADRAEKTVQLLHQRIADGAVIAPAVPDLKISALRDLARSRLPLVVMHNTVAPEGFDVVRAPEADACGEALDDLLGHGRQRVAFIGHQLEVGEWRQAADHPSERLGAYLDALRRHQHAVDRDLVVAGADDRVAAYHVVTDLLGRRGRPDAIFAASARAAVSAIWAIRDAGLACPDDVAVIGCGNLPEARITRPTLSTAGPATSDYTAVPRLLFDRILADTPPAEREVTTPWSFVRRGSS